MCEKICAECKYYRPMKVPEVSLWNPMTWHRKPVWSACLHPKARDIVTGEAGSLYEFRGIAGACGMQGKLFEAKA